MRLLDGYLARIPHGHYRDYDHQDHTPQFTNQSDLHYWYCLGNILIFIPGLDGDPIETSNTAPREGSLWWSVVPETRVFIKFCKNMTESRFTYAWISLSACLSVWSWSLPLFLCFQELIAFPILVCCRSWNVTGRIWRSFKSNLRAWIFSYNISNKYFENSPRNRIFDRWDGLYTDSNETHYRQMTWFLLRNQAVLFNLISF